MSNQQTTAGNRKYLRLLLALVAVLLLPAVADGLSVARLVLHLATAFMFITAIWDVASTRGRLLLALIALGIPAVVTSVAEGLWAGSPRWATQVSDLATVVFLVFVLYEIGTDIFRLEEVTADTLRGACCFFVMLGLMWGVIFNLVELARPGSFSIPAATEVSGRPADSATDENRRLVRRQDLSYFSFVTLTSLGYGDISPVTRVARNLAVIEALTGQLFLAIIIARLVGILAATRRE